MEVTPEFTEDDPRDEFTFEPKVIQTASEEKKFKKGKKQKQDLENLELKEVLATQSGRNVLWRWLEKSGIFMQSYSPNNPEMTFFREGRRSFGNEMLIEIQTADVNAYFEMQKSFFLKKTGREL